MTKATMTQTGPDSAVVGPIVLRPGDITRMVFKPQIVNNKQDENRPVSGVRKIATDAKQLFEQPDDISDMVALLVSGDCPLDHRTEHTGERCDDLMDSLKNKLHPEHFPGMSPLFGCRYMEDTLSMQGEL